MSETLDPDDWDEMRTLGHRVVDDVVDYLKTVRERPVWQQIPTETAAIFERGLAGGAKWYTDYGLQLSRRFRALKVWLSIKEHGLAKYERLIDQNMEQARYLEGLVESCPQLELMAPVILNVVCFRFNPGAADREELNKLNQELLIQLHEGGVVLPSYTTLKGRYCLRAAIVNHRSRLDDFDALVDEVLKIGSRLSDSP
jgi:glutamate/tyrosine decarboxylase-like PLP-dependent enzyme